MAAEAAVIDLIRAWARIALFGAAGLAALLLAVYVAGKAGP